MFLKASLTTTMSCDEGQLKAITSQVSRYSSNPDPSGMNIWITLPGKEPQLAEVLDEIKESMEWVVEEVVKNTSYDQVQKQGL